MVSASEDLRHQHAALTQGVGVVAMGPRTCVEIRGADRARLLHGFCTQDIKRLVPGQGAEAFLTNTQGKTIGFIWVFCDRDALWLNTEPGLGGELIRHLDKYVIREDVQFVDRSDTYGSWVVSGPRSVDFLQRMLGADVTLPGSLYESTHVPWKELTLAIRRVDYAGSPTFLCEFPEPAREALAAAILASGVEVCSVEALEIARVEAGVPRFGIDLTADNLPQEIDRNAKAINFTKGCYLGQETVARIDALGHVNRLLRAVQFAGPAIPQVGCELRKDAKVVGRVTSAVWSWRLNAPLALAYLRRELAVPGTPCDSDAGPAQVIPFPAQW